MIDPLYKLRIQAILTANDDGTEAATISSGQIKDLVDRANEIYSSAKIEFQFDPAKDLPQKMNPLQVFMKYTMRQEQS